MANNPNPQPREVDPFLDTDFAPLDTRDRAQHIAELGKIAEDHPELQKDLVQEPAPGVPLAPAPVVDEDQPEVFDVDGGTVTLTHDDKGWHGKLSLDDGGGDEVFHGKTQKELMTKVLAGKVKASAHIRKLNKKLKLGTPVDDPVPAVEQPVQPKQLNANDIFEIKTALEADPDKAFDLRFQKKYGMTEDQFVALVRSLQVSARKGEEAYEELSIESVSKEFLEAHKDEYYPYAENGEAIMTWLCRNKLKRNVTKSDNFGTISSELLRKNLYTVENLEEAFEDLRDSGLLTAPPEPELPAELPPEPAPVVARQPQPAQPASNPRIVASRRQARGGLGIRSSAVSNPQPEEPRAPSVDELENMSSAELSKLYSDTLRFARSARR
jgi:hypothetical protein